MKTELDEVQCGHIYSALGVAGNEWQKVKKSLAKLNKEDPSIDAEIALNAHLRRLFNPHAEEEAREKERAKRDSAQLDIPGTTGSSGETGGGHPAGERVMVEIGADVEEVPPTDEVIRDNLIACDRMVLLSAIRGWTSTERDAAMRYTREFDRVIADDEADPVAPDFLDLLSISQERADALVRIGPYKTRGLPEGVDDATSTLIYLVGGGQDDGDLVEGEYPDGTEAEIKCALLNRDVIRTAAIDAHLVTPWVAAGPWTIVAEPGPRVVDDSNPRDVQSGRGDDRWYVVLEAEGTRERVLTDDGARMLAAIYNRHAAGRDADGAWRNPPIHLSSDAVQEIKAAAEGGQTENNEGDRPSEDDVAETPGTTDAARATGE